MVFSMALKNFKISVAKGVCVWYTEKTNYIIISGGKEYEQKV